MTEYQYQPIAKIGTADSLATKSQAMYCVDNVSQSTHQIQENNSIRFHEILEKVDTSQIATQIQHISAANNTVLHTLNRPSPMDVAKSSQLRSYSSTTVSASSPTTANIQEQARNLRQAFERPRAVLLGADNAISSLPNETVATLSTHLEHVDTALQEATHIVKTVEPSEVTIRDQADHPAVRFLNFLTDGDKQVTNILSDLSKLDLNGQKMTPQLLMAVQVKMGFVQQELEFFTNVLNKSLESIKTVMNVQI